MHPRDYATDQPDRAAAIDAASGQVLTYAELETEANQGAQLFRKLGLRAGDAFALICDNRLPYFTIYWAAKRAGLTLVPVSTRLKPPEIAYIAEDSESKVVLVADGLACIAEGLADALSQIKTIPKLIVIGAAHGLPSWEALCAEQPPSPIADEGDGGHMSYSSGTTGRPKGIRARPSQGMEGFSAFGVTKQTIYLSPAPLYHMAPLTWCIGMQFNGATVILMRRFEPEAFLAAIERYRVDMTQVVPTMLVRLLNLPEDVRGRYDLSSLTTVFHSAAPCPVPTKRATIEWLGPIVTEYYASSEGVGFTMIGSEEWLRKPGSVGRAVGSTVHVCDEAGTELKPGETGAVYFEGDADFHYHNDAEKTLRARNPLHPTWSTFGDIGHLDEDGYLFLSDRKDFMIISGGVNIYPQEVENLLVTHRAVADAAVFGVPNAEFGEEVKAVIQPKDWAAAGPELAQELIAWCRTQLADLKCPRSVDFEKELPRADTGKLFKKELKARYWLNA